MTPSDRFGDADLDALGWNARWAALAADAGEGDPARVIRHDGSSVLLAGGGTPFPLPLRPSLEALAVGDWVLHDGSVMTAVLHRTSLLQRRDPSGGAQLMAANVDVVGIVCGLDRPVKTGRIERAVVLAWDAGATPFIVLTKADLAEDATDAVDRASTAAPGVDVAVVCAPRGTQVDLVRATLQGRTAVFIGESGAGKSTLVNALAGEDLATTADVRAGDAKGRHTTTSRRLHVLPGDICLIDTPGIREVGLWAQTSAVDEAYDEIIRFATGCQFSDCAHDLEPECAVRAAVERGDLSEDRYESWQRLRKEAESAELRADPPAQRRADRRFSRMAREAQRMKRR